MAILVVEDEPEILNFVVSALEDEGFEVAPAADGQRAIEVAAEQRPDLVVLDMRLPRLDGEGVAQELHRLHGDVPILLMTADGQAEEKAQRIGAFNYLHKPFDLDRLLQLVQERVHP